MISDKKKLISNLASIKRVLGNNENIYKFYPLKYIRLGLIIAGSEIIIFCGLFFILNRYYRNFLHYPLFFKVIFISLTIIFLLLLAAFKIIIAHKRKKEIQSRHKPPDENQKISYLSDILVTLIPWFVFIGLLVYLIIEKALFHYLSGIIVSSTAIQCVNTGRMLKFKDLVYFGLYLFSWGITAIIFPSLSSLLIIAGSFGIGLLLWGIYLFRFKNIYYMK